MRTPNCACVICQKPLYRRPSDLARVRHVACLEHRGQAQAAYGVTEAQAAALKLGRRPGDNRRAGYRHRAESKAKTSASHKAWCAANPDRVAARGEKVRGEAHYRWKGGASKLNASIRRMTENRRWMDAVKARDGHKCTRCAATETLEAHHRTPLADLIEALGISSRDNARLHAAELWALDNGVTLCRACHYEEHGRTRYAD